MMFQQAPIKKLEGDGKHIKYHCSRQNKNVRPGGSGLEG